MTVKMIMDNTFDDISIKKVNEDKYRCTLLFADDEDYGLGIEIKFEMDDFRYKRLKRQIDECSEKIKEGNKK